MTRKYQNRNNSPAPRKKGRGKALWCNNQRGREHQPTIVDNGTCTPAYTYTAQGKVESWICRHIRTCRVCGRTLTENLNPALCPDRAIIEE